MKSSEANATARVILCGRGLLVAEWEESIFTCGSISRGKATPRPFCIIDA